ncbi:hypothetical protein PR202_gb26028 [Eleusine coracana subsp. coracana]|uniref:Uncharacterized protein n=1 Tax=Eleusine coracana subsp. coracana TaxID=191504 RepID=A0AAV5FN10_ELECO|nr:hypothetical protein PR202_gb26028 [Eleusine coracana subsp. coracana]
MGRNRRRRAEQPVTAEGGIELRAKSGGDEGRSAAGQPPAEADGHLQGASGTCGGGDATEEDDGRPRAVATASQEDGHLVFEGGAGLPRAAFTAAAEGHDDSDVIDGQLRAVEIAGEKEGSFAIGSAGRGAPRDCNGDQVLEAWKNGNFLLEAVLKWKVGDISNADLYRHKVCQKTGSASSLFERLINLPSENNVLTKQYTMDPEISKFVLEHFYKSKVEDGCTIKSHEYNKKLVPYAFIDIMSEDKLRAKPRAFVENAAAVILLKKLSAGLENVDGKLNVASSLQATAMAKVGPGNLLELEEDHQLAELVNGWNFQQGKEFQAEVLSRIGIFQLRDACQRDTLVVMGPHVINGHEFRFVRHDEAPMNHRRVVYTRKSWIMLLGYLLDLKENAIIKQVVAPFAQAFHWNSEDPSLARLAASCASC